MNRDVHGQNLDPTFSAELVENWRELFPEHDGLSFEEFCRQQECFFESYQTNERNSGVTSDHGQSSDFRSGQEGESSQRRSIELQSDLDEAFAKSLLLWEDLDNISISEFLGNGAGNTEGSSRGTSVSSRGTSFRGGSPVVSQDEVNPDEMTYEQLQLLGDSVGTESRGLSDEFISRLPYFKYKEGFLFQKKKREECVICLMKCKDGVYLTTLPCAHRYHSECITQWLKLNKTCPVCKEEVRYC